MGSDEDEDGGQDDWRARALHYSFGIFIAAGSVRPSVRPAGGDIACLNSESESADVRGVRVRSFLLDPVHVSFLLQSNRWRGPTSACDV